MYVCIYMYTHRNIYIPKYIDLDIYAYVWCQHNIQDTAYIKCAIE